MSTAAKRYAAAHPELGLKGIGLGEYPFYRDWPSLHLRFFVAFAEAGNVAYAGRSDYMDSPTNSGLVFSDGRKKPLYWVFHAYARMRGRRVPAEKKGRHRAIQALATLDEGARRLEILLGNDQNTDEEVTLLLPGAPGPAKLAVQAPAEAGWTPISTAEAAKADTLKLPALAVPAKGVLRLLVDFPGKDPFPAAKPPAIAPAK